MLFLHHVTRIRYVLKNSFTYTRRLYNAHTVLENEIVLLKSSVNDRAEPILTEPLKSGLSVSYKRLKNLIKHDDIIGKRIRGIVRAKNGICYRIHRPTLGEYTDRASRLVTPIYSQDANLIVSLLDLHPTVPGVEVEKLEIFEAGTGTGALTLYLARAIHAANSAAPEIPSDIFSENPAQDLKSQEYNAWRAQRRAVIHTLDIHEGRSRHAAANIKKYRDGMYFPHIDFHTGCIETVLSERLASTLNVPFLEHAILDLPSPEKYMKIVSKAVKERGLLLIFAPSITQINKSALFVRKMALPWVLENVLELGGMLGTGGREWDVRFVQPRALLKALAAEEQKIVEDSIVSDGCDKDEEPVSDPDEGKSIEDSQIWTANDIDGGWEMVCRPKVGIRITNGGFVGIWHKAASYDSS